jgi:hypothetical protein
VPSSGPDLTEPDTATAAPKRRMLDGPGPEVFAALPEAIEVVLGDPGYRRAADDVARAIDDLPPVDAAVDVLEAISSR